jgi:hypothetical protein
LLELGLFIGALGRKRTFVVYDRSANMKIPSDLAGVTLAHYQPHGSGNLVSALGASSTQIEGAVRELGLRRRPEPGFSIDLNTQFQIVCDLLDDAARQFFVLMHESSVSLRRGLMFDNGPSYEYERANRSSGTGFFSVDQLCSRLADAGLLLVNLRNDVQLAPRGHEFAAWLIERGYKAEYFRSAKGGWGTKPLPAYPPPVPPVAPVLPAPPPT